MLSAKFLEHAERLVVRGLGTEHVALLLYSVARMTRPRVVLEVGVGYTTPFLLQALADNQAEFRRSVRLLADKTSVLKERLDEALSRDDMQRAASARAHWEGDAPSLADPEYYQTEYAPELHAIDDFSGDISRSRLQDVVDALELGSLMKLHARTFRGAGRELSASGPFDLVWFDVGGYEEYRDFIEEYWDLVNPRGGVIVLHYTLNNPFIGHLVKDLKLRQATREFNDFELLSLLEPHKFRQNSLTALRRTKGVRDDFEWPERLSRHLLASVDP